MKVPVVTTIMGKGAIPAKHPYYIGNSGMHGRYAANIAVSECDVLFSIGTRFNDRITGDLNEFAPNAKIVHIDIGTAAISRNVVVRADRGGCKAGAGKAERMGGAEKYKGLAGADSRMGSGKSTGNAQRQRHDAADDTGGDQCGI